MNATVTIASCNFDDVILGVFEGNDKGRSKAMRLAKAVAKDPNKRRVDHMPNDTDFVRSIVFAVTDSTHFVEIASFELGGKRRIKAKA